MERYIGLDAHASNCTLGVIGPGGKRPGSHVVETNVKALTDVLPTFTSDTLAGNGTARVLWRSSSAGFRQVVPAE